MATLANQQLQQSLHAATSAVLSGGDGDDMPAACDRGFQFSDMMVNMPGNELVAMVQLSAAPAGVTVTGLSVLASPHVGSRDIYCMGMIFDADGLQLPIALSGCSSAPQFPQPTNVMGVVIVSYNNQSGSQMCYTSEQFTVGGVALPATSNE